MLDIVLKRFEDPDEVTTFDKGRFEVVRAGGLTIGRATYQPGWKWSVDVGETLGQALCPVEHVGLVLSGKASGLAASAARVWRSSPARRSPAPPDRRCGS